MIDNESEPGSWARALARGCVPNVREYVEKTPRHRKPDCLGGGTKIDRVHTGGTAR